MYLIWALSVQNWMSFRQKSLPDHTVFSAVQHNTCGLSHRFQPMQVKKRDRQLEMKPSFSAWEIQKILIRRSLRACHRYCYIAARYLESIWQWFSGKNCFIAPMSRYLQQKANFINSIILATELITMVLEVYHSMKHHRETNEHFLKISQNLATQVYWHYCTDEANLLSWARI